MINDLIGDEVIIGVKVILKWWVRVIGNNSNDFDRIVSLESRIGWEDRCKVWYSNSWCFLF